MINKSDEKAQKQSSQFNHRELLQKARKAKGSEREQLEQAALREGVDKFVNAGSGQASDELVEFLHELMNTSATIQSREVSKLLEVTMNSKKSGYNQRHDDYKTVVYELLKVADINPGRSDEIKDALLNKVDWRSIRGDADTKTVLSSIATKAGLRLQDSEIKALSRKGGGAALEIVCDNITSQDNFSAFMDALSELRQSGSVTDMSTLRDIVQTFNNDGYLEQLSEQIDLNADQIEDRIRSASHFE